MSVSVPSSEEFDQLVANGVDWADRAAARAAALESRLALLEARVTALEIPPVVVPPPPVPIPIGSREPAGFTVWTDRSFDAVAAGGWSSQGPIAIVQDAAAPVSAPNVARITYPAGFVGGEAPAFAWRGGLSGFRSLYVRFGIKISDNWRGHSSLVNKIGFIWLHGNPTVFFSMDGAGSGALEAVIRVQNSPADRILRADVGRGNFVRAVWHVWETLLVCNTPGQPNGEAHWWLDGTKVGEYRNVIYSGVGQSTQWGDEVSWRPIWGGVGDVLAQPQHMWMDHFYVSGAP